MTYRAINPGDVLPTEERDEQRRRAARDAVAWALHDEQVLSTAEGFWVGSIDTDGRLVLSPEDYEIVEMISATVLGALNEHDAKVASR